MNKTILWISNSALIMMSMIDGMIFLLPNNKDENMIDMLLLSISLLAILFALGRKTILESENEEFIIKSIFALIVVVISEFLLWYLVNSQYNMIWETLYCLIAWIIYKAYKND